MSDLLLPECLDVLKATMSAILSGNFEDFVKCILKSYI